MVRMATRTPSTDPLAPMHRMGGFVRRALVIRPKLGALQGWGHGS